MEQIPWILLSLAICCSAALLLWRLRGWLSAPVQGSGAGRLYAVVTGDSPESLEHTVGSLLWLIRSGKLDCDILIVTANLAPETLAMAGLLARDEPRIRLCGGNICFTEDTWRKTDT